MAELWGDCGWCWDWRYSGFCVICEEELRQLGFVDCQKIGKTQGLTGACWLSSSVAPCPSKERCRPGVHERQLPRPMYVLCNVMEVLDSLYSLGPLVWFYILRPVCAPIVAGFYDCEKIALIAGHCMRSSDIGTSSLQCCPISHVVYHPWMVWLLCLAVWFIKCWPCDCVVCCWVGIWWWMRPVDSDPPFFNCIRILGLH